MVDIPQPLLTWMIGAASGFFVSVPVGPTNVSILNEGAQRGFRYGFFIGLGAATMETIYCAIGFAGFSGIFDSKLMRAVMELISFVLMAYLGVKYLTAREIPDHVKSVDRIEERLHPHGAFMIGFVRVLGNPAVLLFWVTFSATFVAHEWVDPNWRSKAICICGVTMGAILWFLALSYGVSLGHRKFSPGTLLWMSHISGIFLLVFAVTIGARLVLLLWQAHRQAGSIAP